MDLSRYQMHLLRQDAVSALYRATSSDGGAPLLLVTAASPDTVSECHPRFEYVLSLADRLDQKWAATPLSLERHDGREFLVLQDKGGLPLTAELGRPFELGRFLAVATNAAAAVRQVHERGLIHRDLRADRFLADDLGRVWLLGFGKAGPQTNVCELPATARGMADSLPYVSPEQTGRMKRPVDSRSDLYSLGVVFYQMLTGELPFMATDATEWIHSHVARRPIPPRERNEAVPPVLESIVLKLLSKNSDERYQTAAGLVSDLRRCLDSWNSTGALEDFEVGTADGADRLNVPDRLYGRSTEMETIASAFDFVRSEGGKAVALVSGPTGVGKSSLIRELRKLISSSECMFASGKFDQYTRDIPYATIAQAFRGLVRQILALGESELGRWRTTLLASLGPNAQLMINLIPELALVIGEQPPAPELQPHEAKARFNLVFQRFIEVFARAEHPLVLFIDDVQWLDVATIELIKTITLDDHVRHLFLIFAYRDDEVQAGHPVLGAREALRNGIRHFEEVKLGPLDEAEIAQLLADILRREIGSVAFLAQLVGQKTGGNPFFVLHFLEALELEGQLAFDQKRGEWTWDESRISATRITDNVADLVVSKLGRLPSRALEIVKLMSCLGNGASAEIIAVITGKTQQQIAEILQEAVAGGLLFRSEDDFVLVHDRVQEEAYRMIPQAERPEIHFRIGQALLSNLPPDALKTRIFQVADQLARGLGQVLSGDESVQIAEAFLDAGRLAKANVAYHAALKYLRTGLSLLGDDAWEQYDLRFALELQQAECEFLTGEHAVAETHLGGLAAHARNRVDRGAVVGLRSSLNLTLGDQDKAVEVALEYLRDFGIEWTAHPADDEVRAGVEELYRQLAGRPVNKLVELPRMRDPDWLAAMEVLAYTILPAIVTDRNLEDLIYAKMVSLSLSHGNCDASCYAYVSVIIPLGLRFGDYETGKHFGKLGLDLVDSHGLDRFKARVYSCYGCFVVPWTQHLPASEHYSRQAMAVAIAGADVVFSVAPAQALVSHLLVGGVPLDMVQRDAQSFLVGARRTGFSLAADGAVAQLLLIRELGGFDRPETGDALPEMNSFESYLQEAGDRLKIVSEWHWIYRMQARFLSGDYPGVLEAARRTGGAVHVRSFIEIAEFHFYKALAHATLATEANKADRVSHLEAIRSHRVQIDAWARSSPENFTNRSLLLAAEAARLDDRQVEALQLYEEAAGSARHYGFVQNEGLANELAARFCAHLGLRATADNFLRSARSCYVRWGALAKVRQLDEQWPGLIEQTEKANSVLADSQPLDMAAVFTMSQAVSGEILLDRLIERLMITVLEHSGAVRGLLLLPRDGQMQIVAEAVTDDDRISVRLENFTRSLPETVLAYVTRTQEVVILDGVLNDSFASDPYFQDAPSTSILCVPIVKLKQLVGVLFLENGLSTNLFTQEQVAVLELLASQAAISLENAGLYQAARDTQEKARRAAEELRQAYDMIPALAWTSDIDGTLLSFNKRWYDFTGLTREQSMGEGWARAIHPEDIGKVQRKWAEVLHLGEAGEIEARMRRSDGAVRTFLIRATPMRDEHGAIIKWYGTNIDIDDLKRMEEAQSLLARAGRLTALGELTASIAHEVNQPLMAIVMNAATCLKWLSEDQIDVGEAREAAERIIRDGHRAGDVIASIRALARKAPLSMEILEVNSMIESVIVLTRGELQRQGIVLSTDLDPSAGAVVGDRIQLQQVVLNLILNAAEAMASVPGGKRQLHLRTERRDDGKVLIVVADSGTGVDPQKSDQIFDAFFTTKEAGLGMGLSICRSIVEAHGGTLWVAPNEPTGSVFSFTLKGGAVVQT
ncbi:AAA family ATPase [Rhizobium mesoamericanum]|uniref:histidine kinase n=1 Tax=Rhizobium mesoamericanum STM3625 TaxID=1211777 RepID=K0Q3J7_9HYPH|nr:AAA family ATPase [Rhizobium mesoamericanum]CCM77279.1 Sensor protein [Rhizobium mesoamericanum STM3625]